jgi:hypothetical protein
MKLRRAALVLNVHLHGAQIVWGLKVLYRNMQILFQVGPYCLSVSLRQELSLPLWLAAGLI